MRFKVNSQIYFLFLITVLSVFLSSSLVAAQEPVGSDQGSLIVGKEGGYIYVGGPGINPVCGNSLIEAGEQCDSDNLDGETCESLLGIGYTGALSCNDCVWDTSQCVAPSTGGGTGGGGGSSSGGGGGSKKTTTTTEEQCTESWGCRDWSTCINSEQSRTCTDANNCGTTELKPAEERECESEESTEQTESTEETGKGFWSRLFPGITGAAIGGKQVALTGIYALAIVIAIVAAYYIRSRMNKAKARKPIKVRKLKK